MGKILEAHVARTVICALVTIVLGACGGGGGGGSTYAPITTTTLPGPTDSNQGSSAGGAQTSGDTASSGSSSSPDPIVASSSVEAKCAAPRTGIDPTTNAAYPDRAGSLADEKSWVRAWIDETYLWYDEVPMLAAKDYATPVAYFDVLKTSALTASGKPKDRFHFSASTEAANADSQGAEIGYGMTIAFLSAAPPRDLRVAYTESDSPAAQAQVVRGDRLIAADGIDIDATRDTDVARINAALAPLGPGEQHTFKLLGLDGTDRTVVIAAAAIQRDPVPTSDVRIFAGQSGKQVGYMLFNEHSGPAEYGLANAMSWFKGQQISDLVVDMRYNGGGLVAIASELAYMVGSTASINGTPLNLTGKTFEQLQTNRKNPFRWTADDAKVPFFPQTLGYSADPGFPLPQLGLSHVTVLAGPDTCSASEAVINALRGVGVAVDIVGGTTCGKPYGFIPQDNCGTTYFAIQFHGVNDKGFGDYGDGFAPTCAVVDDFTHQLGDPQETRLGVALNLMDGGVCPTQASAKTPEVLRSKAEAERAPYLRRSPMREIQWLSRPKR